MPADVRTALVATVTILLDPKVIGKEAETEWGGELAPAAACDWMSGLLSEHADVLDWRYEDKAAVGEPLEHYHWSEIVIDRDQYTEGDMDAR